MSNSKDNANSVEQVEITGIMRTESGRNVIRRLLISTGYFADVFSEDPVVNAFRSGRRSVGVTLFNQLKSEAPEELKLLMKEYLDNG